MSEGGPLKNRVVRSGLWVGVSDASLAVLGIVRSVVMARLLTPDIFGLMGLAQSATTAIETFTRPGIGEALIVRQQSFEEARSTGFTLLAIRGVLMAIVLTLSAPWVARFYARDELSPMLQALSLVFVFSSLQNINIFAKRRELEFRQLTYLSQATAWVSLTVTIGATVWLRNVWALVIGQVASVAIGAVLSYWIIPGSPRLSLNSAIARDLMSYGKFITGASMVLFVASQLDVIVIGKLLSVEQLGFYALAFTATQQVSTTLSKTASSIMMPAYSKVKSDLPALKRAFLRTVSLVMLVILPTTAGMILVAAPLIEVVYGARWLPAVEPLRLLAVFGLFMSLVALSGYLFQGMGVPSVAFKLGVLRLTIIAILLVPMIQRYGISGAAVSVSIGIVAQWLAGLYFLRKLVTVSLSDMWHAVSRPLATTLAMAVVVGTLSAAIEGSTAAGLIALVSTGAVTYAALNWSVVGALRKELSGMR